MGSKTGIKQEIINKNIKIRIEKENVINKTSASFEFVEVLCIKQL
ncbi:hypothetical protein [Clostridium sp. C2-6-12]|nr:hypothetical protein [Clostridium sp. C2-6-12]